MLNKTSYEEGKKEETRDMKGAPGIYVHCVARKREGLALVSVARAEP